MRLEDERLKLQNDVRTTLIQALGGLAVLVGIFFTWGQLDTNRQQVGVARDQLENTKNQVNQQLKQAEQQQIAERFARVTNQLGDKALELRIGGVYGLGAIAQDAPNADRVQIIEVLAAFVREHGNWNDGKSPTEKTLLQARAPEVQAAITVLSRITRDKDEPLDLGGTDLRQVRFDHANTFLQRADLGGVHLEGTNLRGAHLESTDLHGAVLCGAQLQEARLTNKTRLTGARANNDTRWPTTFNRDRARRAGVVFSRSCG
jgi:hypothetical protein